MTDQELLERKIDDREAFYMRLDAIKAGRSIWDWTHLPGLGTDDCDFYWAGGIINPWLSSVRIDIEIYKEEDRDPNCCGRCPPRRNCACYSGWCGFCP